MNNSFYNEIKKYFDTTPADKILEEWKEIEKNNNIGPTIQEFVSNSVYYYVLDNIPCQYPKIINNDINPKFSSGFLIYKINNYAKSNFSIHKISFR